MSQNEGRVTSYGNRVSGFSPKHAYNGDFAAIDCLTLWISEGSASDMAYDNHDRY